MDFLLTFFFLATAHHWNYEYLIPWRMPHPIRIVINYVIGTVGMLAPFIWWLYLRGEMEVIEKLIGFIVAAGMAPVVSYLNDHYKSIRRRANEAEERESLLKSQHEA